MFFWVTHRIIHILFQNVRCLQPTEVYSLSIRPFTRLIKRRSPDTMDLVRAYVQMKLKFRIEHSLGEKVPLMHSLYVKAEREYREKSLKGKLHKSFSDVQSSVRTSPNKHLLLVFTQLKLTIMSVIYNPYIANSFLTSICCPLLVMHIFKCTSDYSKICVKRPLKNRQNKDLNEKL